MPDKFSITGHEAVDGVAKQSGNGAHVYVPKDWAGAEVKAVRTSEPTDKSLSDEIKCPKCDDGGTLATEDMGDHGFHLYCSDCDTTLQAG